MKNPKKYFEGFLSGASRISRVWGRHSPTRFPQGQNERKANFGTSVESCSKKTAKLPLYSLLRREMQIWKVLKNFLIKLFDKAGKSARFLVQKNRKPFVDFLSWYAAVMGGGYSVVIPRKQTCSPYLKPSLCNGLAAVRLYFFPQVVNHICNA